MLTFDATHRSTCRMMILIVVVLGLLDSERCPLPRFRGRGSAIPKFARPWFIRRWSYYVLQCSVLRVQRILATFEHAGFSFVIPT
jgi:hypothetical protein